MAKIGIKLFSISEGRNAVYSLNESAVWARKCRDLRNDLKVFSNKDDKTIDVVMFAEEGFFYVVNYLDSAGRSGDGFAAWIYVPYSIHLDNYNLAKLVGIVRTQISTGFDKGVFDKIFSTDFPNKGMMSFWKLPESVQDAPFAYRYYGNGTPYSLNDLLNSNLYQSYYGSYSALFLIDNTSGISVSGGASGADLTNKRLTRNIIVEAPDSNEMGFTPYINDHPFNGTYCIPETEHFTVVWKKQGWRDIVKKVAASDAGRYGWLPREGESQRMAAGGGQLVCRLTLSNGRMGKLEVDDVFGVNSPLQGYEVDRIVDAGRGAREAVLTPVSPFNQAKGMILGIALACLVVGGGAGYFLGGKGKAQQQPEPPQQEVVAEPAPEPEPEPAPKPEPVQVKVTKKTKVQTTTKGTDQGVKTKSNNQSTSSSDSSKRDDD